MLTGRGTELAVHMVSLGPALSEGHIFTRLSYETGGKF